MPTIPKLYQPLRFIITHAKFVASHTYICNQLIIYKSCRDHANFHTKPIICNLGIILLIPHTSLYTYHSSYIHTQPKQTIQEQQISNITTLSRPAPRPGWGISLRRDNLAQASPPPPKRGLKKEQESNAGSRLGETPLAWASCLLAQNTLWSPGRPLAQETLGEPLHISPGRVELAWARLSVFATVRTCTTHTHTPTEISKQFIRP